jgi:tRNA pseudouridine55 synthase
VILDKPVGMTSTHAVAVLKRLFNAKRAGHAGTLDPWPRAACRLRSAKPPRPFPSSWMAASVTVSPCAGAKSATPMTPRARPPRPAPIAPPRQRSGPAAAVHRDHPSNPAAVFGHQDSGRAGLRHGP